MSYATIADFQRIGLPGGALESISFESIQGELDAASDEAGTYVGCKYTMPISAPYDRTLVRAVCCIAGWNLMAFRGFNPENAGDQVVRQRWTDSIKWLERVANGQARMQVIEASPPSLQPDLSTNAMRGYSPDPNVTNAPIVGTSGGGWGV